MRVELVYTGDKKSRIAWFSNDTNVLKWRLGNKHINNALHGRKNDRSPKFLTFSRISEVSKVTYMSIT